jgi:hypothetical protein
VWDTAGGHSGWDSDVTSDEPSEQIFTQRGEPLRAHFKVERGIGGLEVVFASSGGAKSNPRARNLDYVEGLELILSRLADRRATITDVLVDSLPARRLPVVKRHVDLSYPIELDPTTDVADFRRLITQGQRTVARSENVSSSAGNNRKRIRLAIGLASETSDLQSFERFLAHGADTRARSPFGSYRGPTVNRSRRADPWAADPSALDRSRFAHAATQEALRIRICEAGYQPLSPTGEPDFDIAWSGSNHEKCVAEVKSLTDTNEAKQLRLGLGQVVHYKAQLERHDPRVTVRAVLAVEKAPADDIWVSVCESVGVTITWPPLWPRLFDDIAI